MERAGGGGNRRLGLLRRFGLVLSGVSVVGAGLVTGSPAGATTVPTPNWVTQHVVLPTPTELTSVSCPSVSECVAVGASVENTEAILRSTDGGATWSGASVPAAAGIETAVSCPSTTVCVTDGLLSTDGGATWTATPSTGLQGYTQISCGAVHSCVAVGVTGPYNTPALGYSTDEGATWTLSTVPAGLNALGDVSCTSASDCMATAGTNTGLGLILITTDGGATWSLTPEQSPQYGVYLSCSSPTDCIAAERASSGTTVVMFATTNAWATWTAVTMPASVVSVSGISCASTSDCTVIASNADASQGYLQRPLMAAGLGPRVPSPTEANPVAGISCVAGTCVAVGSIPNTNGNYPLVLLRRPTLMSPWIEGSQPAGVIGLDGYIGFNGVSCVDARTCVAVGGSLIESTKDGGFTWSPTPTPDGQQTLKSVSCADVSHCVAVGGTTRIAFGPPRAALAYFTADGTTWHDASLPSGIQLLKHVTCPSTTFCVAVGIAPSAPGVPGAGVVITSNDGGATWKARPLPNGIGELQAVVCTSTMDCLVGGGVTDPQSTLPVGYVLKTIGGGATWSSLPLPPGTGIVTALSCGSALTCVGAVYGQVDTVTYPAATTLFSADGGSTWSTGAMPSGVGDLEDTSCVGQICSAVGRTVGSDGLVIGSSDGGRTWQPQAAGYEFITGVSCTAPATCEAVGRSAAGTSVILGATPLRHGYWLVGGDGGIFSFGAAQFHGSTGNLRLQRPVVGITPTADDGGYWLDAADGGVFAFGDAGFRGSIPGLGIAPAGTAGPGRHLNAPVVGMVPSADGGGYFMVASDGGVFAFGDAKFDGSCPSIGGCSGAAVAVVPDASGNGYWLVTATGHVYAFGDATNYGGLPVPLGVSVTSAVRTPDGHGYWILTSDGTVSAYGDATALGNLAVNASSTADPATAILATSDGGGYWIATADGAVYPFGDAPDDGSMAGKPLNAPIIAGVGW